MDSLKVEEIMLSEKILALKKLEEANFLSVTEQDLEAFMQQYKVNLNIGDVEQKKAILRSMIDTANSGWQYFGNYSRV